jgi:hypothetical protein
LELTDKGEIVKISLPHPATESRKIEEESKDERRLKGS